MSLKRAGTGSASHHLMVGREEITAAVATRCGIPVGTLTAGEGTSRSDFRCGGNGAVGAGGIEETRATGGSVFIRRPKRLTKVVHFKPLGLETVREILGKLMDSGVTVELNESVKELILVEGISKEYGARNLVRVWTGCRAR